MIKITDIMVFHTLDNNNEVNVIIIGTDDKGEERSRSTLIKNKYELDKLTQSHFAMSLERNKWYTVPFTAFAIGYHLYRKREA